MIKHHPSQIFLSNFVTGDLPASIAIGVSIHCDMCPTCQQEVNRLTDTFAAQEFDDEQSFDFSFNEQDSIQTYSSFGNMIDAITSDDEISENSITRSATIEVKGKRFNLPRSLNHVRMSNWLNLGKLSRSSLNLDEGPLHSHLLHIDKEGEVPAHTHRGFEITLLLDGTFSDEMGDYVPGDFIELNGEHNHQPKTAEGCLCYTVADDALQFTEGFHKLFNPIGSLLY